MTKDKSKDKTPAVPASLAVDPNAKGLPIFTLYSAEGAKRRIVFDLELGCIIMDGSGAGRSIVHFAGNSYEIDAPMEEAVDEILAVTVAAPAVAPPVNAEGLRLDGPTEAEYRAAGYVGGYPPEGFAVRLPADESQQGQTQQEQAQA